MKIMEIEALPAVVDLRPKCPPVLDQGRLGSCTANAIASAHRFDQLRQKFAPDWCPSRLFIYYNERAMEGTIRYDAGANIRDGMKSIAKQGVCPETEWPYVIRSFRSKPGCRCYNDAKHFEALQYQRVNQVLDELKSALFQGFPVVFGFTVYQSFESQGVAHTGVVPMPQPGERSLGGHAVLMVGYDDVQGRFIVMNSWGTGWGMSGFFTLPYNYVVNDNLACDFWTMQLIK